PVTEGSTALYSISREPLPGHGPERVAKGRTRRNTELGKSPMEVTADGPVRQEQSLGDLLVRQTRRREADDLELLGRQTVLNAVTRARFDLSGRPKLRAHAVDPGSRSETLEDFARGVELHSRVLHRPATSEAFAVGQLRPGQIEWPSLDPRERQRQVEQLQSGVVGGCHRRRSADYERQPRRQSVEICLLHRGDVGGRFSVATGA